MKNTKLSMPISSLLNEYDDEDIKFIIGYLPVRLSSFFDNNDEKYSECIDYISASYVHNLEVWTPIPYLLYYQLFITYLYKVFHVYKTFSQDKNIQNIINSYITDKLESKNIFYNDMFDLSNIWEDDFVWRINTLVRCLKKNHISEIRSLVTLRNHVAHIWWEFAEEEKYNTHINIIKSTINFINLKINFFVVEELKKVFYGSPFQEEDYDRFINFWFNDILDWIYKILSINTLTKDQKIQFIKTIYTLQIYMCNSFDSEVYLRCIMRYLDSINETDELYSDFEDLGWVYKYIHQDHIEEIIMKIESINLWDEDKELVIWLLKY